MDMNNPETRKQHMPDMIPLKPKSRESAPSLTDEEYDELCKLVDEFPNFTGDEDPRFKRWEELQSRADKDFFAELDKE